MEIHELVHLQVWAACAQHIKYAHAPTSGVITDCTLASKVANGAKREKNKCDTEASDCRALCFIITGDRTKESPVVAIFVPYSCVDNRRESRCLKFSA